MASIHIYIREQVTGSDAHVDAIAKAVAAVHKAIEAGGGDWHGSATVEHDAPAVAEPAKSLPLPTAPHTTATHTTPAHPLSTGHGAHDTKSHEK